MVSINKGGPQWTPEQKNLAKAAQNDAKLKEAVDVDNNGKISQFEAEAALEAKSNDGSKALVKDKNSTEDYPVYELANDAGKAIEKNAKNKASKGAHAALEDFAAMERKIGDKLDPGDANDVIAAMRDKFKDMGYSKDFIAQFDKAFGIAINKTTGEIAVSKDGINELLKKFNSPPAPNMKAMANLAADALYNGC